MASQGLLIHHPLTSSSTLQAELDTYNYNTILQFTPKVYKATSVSTHDSHTHTNHKQLVYKQPFQHQHDLSNTKDKKYTQPDLLKPLRLKNEALSTSLLSPNEVLNLFQTKLPLQNTSNTFEYLDIGQLVPLALSSLYGSLLLHHPTT